MTASPSSSLARAQRAARDFDDFQAWIRGKGGADLIALCHAIGGDVWTTRARLARHSVLEGHGPYVVRARLQGPLRLLRFCQAGRLPGVSATSFVQIEPDSPQAKAVRTCIEQLELGLAAMQAVSLVGAAAGRRTAR